MNQRYSAHKYFVRMHLSISTFYLQVRLHVILGTQKTSISVYGVIPTISIRPDTDAHKSLRVHLLSHIKQQVHLLPTPSTNTTSTSNKSTHNLNTSSCIRSVLSVLEFRFFNCFLFIQVQTVPIQTKNNGTCYFFRICLCT